MKFSPTKKPAGQAGLKGGETEIRTRDTLLAYTRFPGVCIPRVSAKIINYLQNTFTQILKLFTSFQRI